jgi:hypothetical protein
MKKLIHYGYFYINNEIDRIIGLSEFHPNITILFEYCEVYIETDYQNLRPG